MTPIRNMRIIESRWEYVPHLLVIMLLWSVVMTMDFYTEVGEANERAENMAAQLAECLNGTWRGRAQDGTRVGCMKAVAQKEEEK